MRPKKVPEQEILFAAKFGFLSQKLWREFFTTRSAAQNSRVWRSYIERGYFKLHDCPFLKDILVLDKEGKNYLRKKGAVPVSPVHINQIDHDETVALIALLLMKSGQIEKYRTEAQLKKELWSWTRERKLGVGEKFPDLKLYIKTPNGIEEVAIELELTLKNRDRYRKAMASYSRMPGLKTILFISDKQAIFDSLSRAIQHECFPTDERTVGYINLIEFLKDPMSTTIYLPANKQTTLQQMKDGVEFKTVS